MKDEDAKGVHPPTCECPRCRAKAKMPKPDSFPAPVNGQKLVLIMGGKQVTLYGVTHMEIDDADGDAVSSRL